ncbi:MAG: cysteine dioxygenase family protein [Fimbriimonadales bacterium]
MSAQNTAQELIKRLDAAVDHAECRTLCRAVKDALQELCATGEEFIPADFLRTAPNRYARRLLHADPKGRYTVLVMVWDKGQGTALHDHAGMWCVECVYRGQIEVVSYDRVDDGSSDLYQFKPELKVYAGVGEAGALIPPFEYHTIANALDTPAVTIHVYGGEMTWCHAFVPVEGGYQRERRELCYSE